MTFHRVFPVLTLYSFYGNIFSMISPELTVYSKPKELQTKLPGVTMSELSAAELPDVSGLMDKNTKYFRAGGLDTEYVLKQMAADLTGKLAGINRHTGIWLGEKLIGYVSVEPGANPHDDLDVEISYAVDQDMARQGVAEAAVRAITEQENEDGHNVVAEVEGRNHASKRMLGKIGYEEARHTSNGREVFVSHSLSDEALLRRVYM